MGIKRIIGVGVGATAILTFGATGAFAGEITGNAKPTPAGQNAASACAFSGLEDEPHAPGTVQNWGHTKDAPIILASKGASSVTIDFSFLGGPIVTEGCNAHLYPNHGGE